MKTKTPNVSGRSAWLRDNITKYFSFSAIIILLVALSLTQDNFLAPATSKPAARHGASDDYVRRHDNGASVRLH